MTKHITTFADYTPETDSSPEALGYEAGSLEDLEKYFDEHDVDDSDLGDKLDALREAELDEMYHNLKL